MTLRYIREIFSLSWMVVISRFAFFFIIFSDIVAVSAGTTTGLAAFTMGNYLNTVCWLLGYNFLSGARVYLTHALGDHDETMAATVILVGIRLSAYTALVLFMISLTSWFILPTFDYEPGLAKFIAGVTIILGAGLFFQLYHVVIDYFFEAQERPFIPMVIGLFGLSFNIAGNTVVAAYASPESLAIWIAVWTCVTRFAMAVLAFIAFKRAFIEVVDSDQNLAEATAIAKKNIIQFGWATTISAAGTMVLAAFGLIAGLKGIIVAAAFQIFINLAQFAVNFVNGIVTGMAVKIGKAFTSSIQGDIPHYVWSGIVISFGLSSILFGAFVLLRDTILGLYTESQAVADEALGMLMSVGLIFLVLDAFVRVCSVTARSIGNRTYTTVLTVVTYVTSVALGYVFCVVLDADVNVMFYLMMMANLVIGLGIIARFIPYFVPSRRAAQP